MRFRRGLLAALAVVAVAVVAAPAQAATTRGEYVAQVDPICQSIIPDVKATGGSINRSIRRYVRDVLAGASRRDAAHRYFNRVGRSLIRFSGDIGDLRTKIEAVSVPPQDSGYVTLWLRDISSAQGLVAEAGRALRKRHISAFRSLWAEASAVAEESDVWVGGFGFQYCTD
jgi:hypothetical protein